MKRIFICFGVMLISILNVAGNPVLLPQAYISELFFDNNEKWILEISFFYSKNYNPNDFDSICVKSSNGQSRIKLDNIETNVSLFVITSDSLFRPMEINSNGDRISIISYLKRYNEILKDSLVYGNYLDSSIDYVPDSYSICRFNYREFCKDNSPTIGSPNDTLGTYGMLLGRIYNKNNELVTKGNFEFDGHNKIVFAEDGSFSTKVFSRKLKIKLMWNNHAPGQFSSLKITPMEMNIIPDSLHYQDIHILSDYIVSVKDREPIQNHELKIVNYPNPFNSSTNFYVKIPNELQNQEGKINIYDINGRKVLTIRLLKNSTVRWNGMDEKGNHVASGIYYYQLVLGNLTYINGSMILLK